MLLLVPFFLLSHFTTVTAAVPGCHGDRDKDHRPRLNCTSAGFSSIPVGIEPSTKVLIFPRNQFTSLSWSSFQIFEEIFEVDLSFNQVPEVTPSVAPILPTLSVLRLGSNRLTSLTDGAFCACPALTELYLDNNLIGSLSDQTFSGLGKLEILDLSSNHIKVLPTLMLHPLPAIEMLYLEFNKILRMPDDWFSQKEEVPYLFLSANPWVCSCSLGYFHSYLGDHELNVYVRDGPTISLDSESVVCDSPPSLKDKPLVTLEESDLCPAVATDSHLFVPEDTLTTHSEKTTNAPTTTATTVATTIVPTVVTFYPEYHRVVTRSWYESFTSLFEWRERSPKASGIDTSKVLKSFSERTTYITPTTPATSTLITSTRSSTARTWLVTSDIVPLTTEEIHPSLVTTPSTTDETSAPVTTQRVYQVAGVQQRPNAGTVRGTAVFCFWLFAACIVLCLASVACISATMLRLAVWYRTVYKPLKVALKRRCKGVERMGLLAYDTGVEMEGAGGGGVRALYRSVLFVHREEEEVKAAEEDNVNNGAVGGEGGNQGVPVRLESTAGGGGTEEGGEQEAQGVYRMTLYRLVSKEGWTDVMEEKEESWLPVRGEGRRQGGGGVGSRKRFSVILREETGEAQGGRGEKEWVVGGWEVKGSESGRRLEEEQRSSWGQWLTQYLPNMPWVMATPTEGEAASVMSQDIKLEKR